MDNYAVIIFFTVSILLVDEVSSALLRCRICRGVKYLDNCQAIETCGRDEECYMEMKVTDNGNVEYWGGCRSKHVCAALHFKKSDVVACSKCCPSDDCNTRLCHLPSTNSTGSVRCWSCLDGVDDVRQCDNVATCPDNELCYSRMMTVANSVKHFMKCHRKEECTKLTMAVMEVKSLQEHPRQTHETPICDICCGSELCNSMPCINIRDRLYLYYKHGMLNNDTLTMQIHHP